MGKLNTRFFILDIKYPFTWGKSSLYNNVEKIPNYFNQDCRCERARCVTLKYALLVQGFTQKI